MPLRGPVPVKLYTKENSECLKLGPMTIYIFEDGSNTDNRVGCMTLELPPATSGPPMHWHRFHDECFFVTKGGFFYCLAIPTAVFMGNKSLLGVFPIDLFESNHYSCLD